MKYSKVTPVGVRKNGLFVIKDVQMIKSAILAIEHTLTEGEFWHKRVSQISEKGLEVLSTQGILSTGISKKLSFCEHCVVGKTKKTASRALNKGHLTFLNMYTLIFGGTSSNSSLKMIKVFLISC